MFGSWFPLHQHLDFQSKTLPRRKQCHRRPRVSQEGCFPQFLIRDKPTIMSFTSSQKSSVIPLANNPYIERESNIPGRQVCYQIQAYPVLTSTRTNNAYAVTEEQLDELTAMVSQMTLTDTTSTTRQRQSSLPTSSDQTPSSLPDTPSSKSLGRYDSYAMSRKTGESKPVLRSARLARK